MITAGWIARRLERMGRELTAGVDRVVRSGEEVRFGWQGPQEVQAFGAKLTALAHNHAEYLRDARAHTAELERSNRYKSEFLANVSHELRTPLNSILLLSKMLAEDKAGLPPHQQRQARIIHAAGRDLRALIDDILDLSRIEAGKLSLNLAWLEPRDMVAEVLELMGPQFADKGLYLRLEVAADAPARIHSDRDKLRQIIKNFLANAVKFTEAGGATVTIGREANGHLSLSVTDSGIGIPAEKHALIFEAFQQADGSTRRRYGGTGLGLSISRELARYLGGGIRVASQEGHGACFTLWLPVDADASGEAAVESVPTPDLAPIPTPTPLIPSVEPAAGPDYQGRWVLLVERDAASLVAETRLLAAFGLRIGMAADFEEAQETLGEESGCALILLAEMVSPENTCDTIKALRAWAPAARLPLVVIGRSGSREAQDRYLAAGADDLIAKPMTPARLAAVLTVTLGPAIPQNPQETV